MEYPLHFLRLFVYYPCVSAVRNDVHCATEYLFKYLNQVFFADLIFKYKYVVFKYCPTLSVTNDDPTSTFRCSIAPRVYRVAQLK